MVIVRIIGGLGNQMFQYAIGRRLAIKLNTKLKLDISDFKWYTLRKFDLDKFKMEAERATRDEIKSYFKFSYYLPRLLQPKIHKLFKRFYKNILYENHFHFDKSILTADDNVYFIGYFQSEKYFFDIADVIRKDFQLRQELSKESKAILEIINNTESVSINVRRGDFVTDKRVRERHGVIDLSYYRKAISCIVDRVSNPHFFLFSDDMPWAKKNIKLKYPTTYVGINFLERVYEDIILGSNCKHNIITNSTFAWWVAWLNNNPKKIVVAPKKWFQTTEYNTKDLYPETWIKI